MLHVILLILKIVGIILASAAGLVVLAALAILLVPLRYQAKGKAVEKDAAVSARLCWLFRILTVRADFVRQKLVLRVKILGITFYDSSRPPKQKKSRKRERYPEETPVLAAVESPEADTAAQEEQMENRCEEAVLSDFPIAEQKEKRRKKPGFFRWLYWKARKAVQKIKKWYDKIKTFLQSLLEKGKSWKERICAWAETGRRVKELLNSDRFRRAWRKVKTEIMRLWKHIRPRKLEIRAHIGLDDPELMGKITAAAGMLYPLYTDHVVLLPEFEQQVMEVEFSLKGRIRTGTLLLAALRLFFDKDIKDMIRDFRKATEEVSYGKG